MKDICLLWLLFVASHLFLDVSNAYRLQQQLDLLHAEHPRWEIDIGELQVQRCLDVSLLLSKSPSNYRLEIQQVDSGLGPLTASQACAMEAVVVEGEAVAAEGYVPEQSACGTRILDPLAGTVERRPFRHTVRLFSPCGNMTAMYKVYEMDRGASRRTLAASAPSPVADFDASASAAAPTLQPLNPAVSQNQSVPPGLYTPGPSTNVACCCGQNNGYSGNGQSCCCGPISICCQATGFCVSQNCTAVFVGSTLIAGAFISFMTCGICIYRARVGALHEPVHLWSRGRRSTLEPGEGRRRRWHPVPVLAPPDAEEGTQRDCPVCLEEVTKNADWLIFPCRHGTCRTCYGLLVAKPDGDAACPLCRTALTEPLPEETPPATAVQLQPMPREPAQPLEGSTSQLSPLSVAGSSLAR